MPNQVLLLEDYLRLLDPQLPQAQRLRSLRTRVEWLRVLAPKVDYKTAINRMVTDFGFLGVIETRDGPRDGAGFPSKLLVESKPGFPPVLAEAALEAVPAAPAEAADPSAAVTTLSAQVAAGGIEKVRRFK